MDTASSPSVEAKASAPGMDRTRAEGRCAACGEFPKDNETGTLTCACGTSWYRCLGEEGTQEDKALLKRNGFQMAQDCQGDVYYVLPGTGHIIHLYPDGTWDSDKAAQGSSLKQYFAWLKPLRAL